MLHKNPQVNAILMRYRDENGVVTLPQEAMIEISEITAEDPERLGSSDPRPVLPKQVSDESDEP